ncbi:GAF and ANTAR domain-containing protein [Cryptosporangium minutisporangium]|uniref:GAF and ANTAR domain-containing protein n=1 Tax=Cryptosporangium minutisporangium TaxID=113569 RepID=A0ABP6T1Q8_9ACTN
MDLVDEATRPDDGREGRLAAAFVQLADTLVDDFDVIDLLALLAEYCVDLVGATASGILLTDQRGALRVAAASSEAAWVMELFVLQEDEGPCYEACRTGLSVSEPDVASSTSRWPTFSARAREVGFGAVHALPLRLRGETIGALSLFSSATGPLPAQQALLARAFADVATIGILQQRAIHEREVLAEQLQTALNNRVVIEQAKGVLAERHELGLEAAFSLLRSTARKRRSRLIDLARAVVADSEILGD